MTSVGKDGGASSGWLVEKEIKGSNPAVPSDDEISAGVSWHLTREARYPWDPPAVAQFFGFCKHLPDFRSSAVPMEGLPTILDIVKAKRV